MYSDIEFAQDGSKVVIRAFGRASIDGFVRYMETRMQDPRWRPEMDVLLDLSGLDTEGVGYAFISGLLLERERLAGSVGSGRTAVVAQDHTFGLVFMFVYMAEERVPVSYRVFTTCGEAEAWLATAPEQEPLPRLA